MVSASIALVSVVVPTRDRPDALARCLEALSAQTVADQLEIIVVDDGSSSPAAVTSVVERHRATLIRRSGAGPAAARNAGARAASGTYLCFTDDDCAPEQDWAKHLVNALREGADAAGGHTVPSRGPLAEASETIARAPVRVLAVDDASVTFSPSNNLACTKSVFQASPFDERYPNAAGEDREWCARLIAAGRTLRYVPAARIRHHQELDLQRFLRQQVRYGEGAFRFRRRGDRTRRLEAPSFYLGLARRGFGRGFVVGVLVCIAQVATAVGFARAALAQRRTDS